eukprot:TRINITY_DN12834_c0_g1_i1.p1 TRINITY_DN12834_c0_g1~~TRINITY_DN12834_c0_g1_i1.p1  ORF type:complete len:386 (+),score=95.66 TRINITY_DN12834_c0_g1_i1:43-1200(+)
MEDGDALRGGNDDMTIVIDPGSGYFKAGMAGGFVPKVVFDSVIGKPKTPGPLQGMGEKCRYIGDEALTKRLVLDLDWPIDKGRIKSFDDMEKLLQFTFDELDVPAEEHPILFSESSFIPQDQRQKLAQLCFEKFNVRGFFAVHEAVMATYGSGRTTALVVDFGEHKTDIIPVQGAASHSVVINEAVTRLNIGGAQMTDYLMQTLPLSGYNFQSKAEREIVREIKEKLCYVSLNAEKENPKTQEYILPDGQPLRIAQQRFQIPEVFFRPGMMSEIEDGLQKVIAKAIDKETHESMLFLRKELAENCLICGGGSMFPGIASRLEQELYPLSPIDAQGLPKWNIRVEAPPHRKYATWFGGSTIAPLITYITREEFEEQGPSSVEQTLF